MREDGSYIYIFFVLVLIEDTYVYWPLGSVRAFGRFTSRAYAEWIQAYLFTARRKRLRIMRERYIYGRAKSRVMLYTFNQGVKR